MQLPLASTEIGLRRSPRAQPETGSSRCVPPEPPVWDVLTAVYSPGPPPPASIPGEWSFPTESQAACWRWKWNLSSLGEAPDGPCTIIFPGQWWKEPETQAPALRRSPTPAASESLWVFQLQWNYSARGGPGPLWRGSRSRDRGVVCNTHTCSFVWPDHVLCFGSMWYHWRNQTALKVQGTAKLCWEAAGPRPGSEKWWGRRQAISTPEENVGSGGERLLWEKKGLREVEVDSDDDNNLFVFLKSFLVDKAFLSTFISFNPYKNIWCQSASPSGK